MKRFSISVAVLSILIAGTASAQMMGPGQGGYGGYGGYGGMMGPGQGGYGGNGGYGGMMGGVWSSFPPENAKALTFDQVTEDVNNYLRSYWNPNLKLAEVWEFDNQFYAEVREKDTGVGAFELLINKWTGAIVPEPGPNMMWNTKYGHMGAGMMGGGMMGGPEWGWGGKGGYRGWGNPNKDMPVTPAQARQYAQQFLDAQVPGTTVEKVPDTFYGYYTITVLDKDGKTYGMLGVNGYSGWVWYHQWHGKFISMREY